MPRFSMKSMKAARALGRRDYREVIRLYKEHLEANPDDAFATDMISQCYVWLGEDDQAIEWGTQVLALEVDFIPTLRTLSGCYHRKGDHDRAYQCVCHALQSAYKFPPETPEIIYKFFGLLSKIPRFRKALDPDRMRQASARLDREHLRWLEWARGYKEWYEASRRGQSPHETVR